MPVKVLLHLECDYPECAAVYRTDYYTTVWHDIRWKPERHDIAFGRVLCPLHRHERFDDIDQLVEEINSMGTL